MSEWILVRLYVGKCVEERIYLLAWRENICGGENILAWRREYTDVEESINL